MACAMRAGVSTFAFIRCAFGERACLRKLIFQKISRIDQFNSFAGQFVRDGADKRVSVATRQTQQHGDHAEVRHRAAENLHMFDLASHDRFFHSFIFEEA